MGQDLPVSRGMYNFDTLTVNFYGDTDVARQLLQAGAFDYNREFSSSGYVVGYDSPALRDGRLQQSILAPDKPTAAQGFVFNLQNPFFKDRRVRQAISLLWDFEWTNKQMMRGFYVRQNSFWPKSEMAATALPDAEELKILEPLRGQIPDEVFTTVYQAPKTDGSGYIRDKQLQALKLLAEAGWTPQHNRLVNAAGEPLEFTFLDGQGGFDRMLLPFKRTLAQIGITLNLRRIDSAQYINRLNARDYDMIVTSFPRSADPIVSPGRELYSLYASQSATQVGSSNSMVLANPAVDQLIDGLVQANSREAMVHYARALDRVLQWGYYMIPNYYSKGTPTVYQNRFGMPARQPLYNEGLETWWEVSAKPLTTQQMSAQLAGASDMLRYLSRRLLLIIPTLLCILIVNFLIVQAAPGGPVEQAIARLQGFGGHSMGGGGEVAAVGGAGRSSRGLDPALIEEIKHHYGFDKPMHERLWLMLKTTRSWIWVAVFRGAKVTDLIVQKLPVSLSLGLWATLITYLISIPLGIRKAIKNGSAFDVWSSTAIIIGNAMPAFLFAILLIVVFAGGSYVNWFPVQGLVSDNFDSLSTMGKVGDYLWHLVLPVTALVIGGFATLTILTKNSFLNEISRQYVITARAKGLTERRVLYGHVFRNAMLLVVAGVPSALIEVFFAGSLLIETIFNLDGLGRMSYEAAVSRDYPVVFGALFLFTLFGLLIKLIGDLCYTLLDPRIDFSARTA